MEVTEPATRSLDEVVRFVLDENRQATVANALAAWHAEQHDAAADIDNWTVIVAFEREQERRGLVVRPALEHPTEDWRHTRPLWVAAGLPFVWLGTSFYPLVWFVDTWAEMRRELDDPDMHPWGHGLGLLVPILSWVIIYDHFRKIETMNWLAETGARVYAGGALLGMIVVQLLTLIAQSQRLSSPTLWVLLTVVSCSVQAAVFLHGQAALNTYWRKVRGATTPSRVHWGEWFALIIGVPLQLLILGNALARS
jgi:hypothetical protein